MDTRSLLSRAKLVTRLVVPRQHIFVLSHMRSYSSLLCHILNSSPEIAGYVETHRSYSSQLDLIALAFEAYRTNKGQLQGRYLLDKILHNYVEIDPKVLLRDDVYAIFSIREPERTIKSTIAMARRKKNPGWKGNPRKVTKYYNQRLERLVEIAELKRDRSFFFVADDLVQQPAGVLTGLTAFLDLKEPLSSEYETFEYTGKPKYGDPGKYIESGQIVKDRDDYDEIDVPEHLVARAREKFEQASRRITELSESSVSRGGP